MKRLLCIVFVIVSIFCCRVSKDSFLQVVNMPVGSKYSLFINDIAVPAFAGVESIKNGSLNILTCTSNNACELYLQYKDNVLGEQISFECGVGDFYNVLKNTNCKVVYTENVGPIISFYCYSDKLNGGIVLPQGKVNLQFCFNNGTATVGSPIIIGSY